MSTETIRPGQLNAALKRVKQRVVRAVDRAVKSAATFGAQRVKENIADTKPFAPIDTGAMRKSVRKLRLQVTPDARGYKIVANPHYTKWMEGGSRPHYPPWTPIFEWVQRKAPAANRKQQGAFAAHVRKKLAAHGHTARGFGKRAVRPIITKLHLEISSELRREFA